MEQGPKNVTVLDGKDATIICRAAGAPVPNVTWIYNGIIITLKNIVYTLNQCLTIISFCLLDSIPVELSSRVQILETSDLLISNVRESDAGLYRCNRSNEAGTVTGAAYLGVMGKFYFYFP